MDIVLYIGIADFLLSVCLRKAAVCHLVSTGDPKNLELLADILSWFSIEAFLNTIGPFYGTVNGSRLMQTEYPQPAIMMVVKFSVAYPLLKYFGYQELSCQVFLQWGFYHSGYLCIDITL